MEAKQNPILIVDDEEIVRDSVTEWLKSGGYNADSAEDGLKALDKLQKKDYDVVVLDMKMPGMDGLQVLKKVHEMNPDIKVIIITAYASVETAVQALKEGAVDYIVKPFEPEVLEDSVAKWVGKPIITLGSGSTETTAPATEEKLEIDNSVLIKMKKLLDDGNYHDAMNLVNKSLGVISPPEVEAPNKTLPETKEEIELGVAKKAKPGRYFPPHFWEGCFSYICGQDTCPFTKECFAAQGRHQRETESFIKVVNQALQSERELTAEEQTELEHAKKFHGVQFDSKENVYFINKTALKRRSGLGGAYFR